METTVSDEFSRSSIRWFATSKDHQAIPRPSRDSAPERDVYVDALAARLIAAVRQADDAVRQACEASSRARRGKFAFGALTALGFAFGIVGISLWIGDGAGPAVAIHEIRMAPGLQPDRAPRHPPVFFTANRLPDGPSATPQRAAEAIPPALASLSGTFRLLTR